MHINGKVCAHLSPCICTYRHVPNNPKKPRYLHWHMKIPWLVNKDAFMRQRRRLPKIRLIDLDNWQLYPHLVHPYISQDSVEDRFICSIEREMFFLLLVRIDYKAFDGKEVSSSRPRSEYTLLNRAYPATSLASSFVIFASLYLGLYFASMTYGDDHNSGLSR